MVLLIIIPMKNGYFIGNIPNIFRQTHLFNSVSVHFRKAKDIVLGVNGEIYNYTTLQDSLEARLARFCINHIEVGHFPWLCKIS